MLPLKLLHQLQLLPVLKVCWFITLSGADIATKANILK